MPKVGSGAKLDGLKVPLSLSFRRGPGRAIGRGCVSGIACCLCLWLVIVVRSSWDEMGSPWLGII